MWPNICRSNGAPLYVDKLVIIKRRHFADEIILRVAVCVVLVRFLTRYGVLRARCVRDTGLSPAVACASAAM